MTIQGDDHDDAVGKQRLIREESILVQEFLRSFRIQSEHVKKQAGSSPTSVNILGPEDQKFIGKAARKNFGFWQGLGAGLVTFVALRRGPVILTRYIQNWLSKRKSSATTTTTAAATTTTAPTNIRSVINSPFQKKAEQPMASVTGGMIKEAPLMKAGWWIIDISLSVAVALTTAVNTTNYKNLYLTASQLPHIPESRVAQAYCPTAMSTYMRLQQQQQQQQENNQTAAAAHLESPQTVMLQALVEFTRACHQRESRNLLMDRNVSSDLDSFTIEHQDA